MEIGILDRSSPHVATVARWIHDQWGFLQPDRGYGDVLAYVREQAGTGGVPSLYLALVDGTAVGTASLVASDLSLRPKLTPWLASVYVVPEHRRRGIASALVRHVESVAAAAGVRRCYLFTPDQQRLYARLGWRDHERLGYKGLDITVMTRDLGPPAATR